MPRRRCTAPAHGWAARPRSGPLSARQRARTAAAPCLPSLPPRGHTRKAPAPLRSARAAASSRPYTPSRGLCGSLQLLHVGGCAAPADACGGSPAPPWASSQPGSLPATGGQGCSAYSCPSAFLAPSIQGSQCNATGLLCQGQALRGAPAGGTWDWRVGGPLTQRQVVLVAGVALATVRAATPGTHRGRCAHQQDGHRGVAASEGRRACQAGISAGGPRSQALCVQGDRRRTRVPDAARAGGRAVWWQRAPTPLAGRCAPW